MKTVKPTKSQKMAMERMEMDKNEPKTKKGMKTHEKKESSSMERKEKKYS